MYLLWRASIINFIIYLIKSNDKADKNTFQCLLEDTCEFLCKYEIHILSNDCLSFNEIRLTLNKKFIV